MLALGGVQTQVSHFMRVHDSAAASEVTIPVSEALDPTERSCVSPG